MATVGLDPAERRPVYIGVSAASLETIGSELSPVFTGDSSASVLDKLVHGSGRTAGPIGISWTTGAVASSWTAGGVATSANVEPIRSSPTAGPVGRYLSTACAAGPIGSEVTCGDTLNVTGAAGREATDSGEPGRCTRDRTR